MFPAKILVATDGSEEARLAVEAAVDLANGTGSELHVVYVLSTVPELPYARLGTKMKVDHVLEMRRLHALRLLEHQAKLVRYLGGDPTATHYREGNPHKEVVKLGKELDAGIIVTGGQKRPWFERIFGPGFSTTVLRRADRPVLVVGRRGTQSSAVRR